MNGFGRSSLIIAQASTNVSAGRCALTGVVFDHLAVVHVVVSRRGKQLAEITHSLDDTLVLYGSECSVVTVFFGEPNQLQHAMKRGEIVNVGAALSEARYRSNTMQLSNKLTDKTFPKFGARKIGKISNWILLGGVLLDKGLATLCHQIEPITLVELQRFWNARPWGEPFPAHIDEQEPFFECYYQLYFDGGWSSELPTGEVCEPLEDWLE